jgi:branched-chain amino acid transport system substrate-binding protein
MIRAQFLAAGAAAFGGDSLRRVQIAQILPGYTPTFRIAVVCPQSGPDGRIGKQLVDGVRGAVDEINRERPSYQSLVLYNAYDDHNSAAEATVQADFATGAPDAMAVVGHLSATTTLATLQVYSNAQIPLIVPTVTDDRITERGFRNVFRLPAKDSDEGSLVAAYVISTGSKAPHVVSQDGPYGPDVAAGFLRRAGAMHIGAVGTQFSLDNPAYDNAAAAVLSHAPDCVVLAGNADDMGPIIAPLRAKGYTGRFVATQGFFDAITLKEFAKEAEGLVIAAPIPYYPMAPSTRQYVTDYENQYGAITPVAAFGYAAVQLVRNAATRMSVTNRLAMIRALANGGSYNTITGNYQFGPYGDVLDPNCYFYRITDGKFSYERQGHATGFMLK